MKERYSYDNIVEKLISIIVITMPIAAMGIRKLQFNILIPLLFILFLIQIYRKGLKISFYEKYMGLWILAIVISLIFSNYSTVLGMKKLKSYLIILALPLLLGQFEIKERDLKYSFVSMLLGVFILFKSYLVEIQSVISNCFGKNVPLYKVLNLENIQLLEQLGIGYRLKGKGDYIAFTAITLGTIILIIFLVVVESRIKWIVKILLSLFFIPLIYFFLLTQSRGMYLSLSLTISIYIIYKMRKKAISIFGIISIFLFLLFRYCSENIFIVRAKNIFKIDNSNTGRLEVYKESFRIFKENLVTGVGFENFILAQNKASYKIHEFYYHSHNMGLKLLSELGIIGFISYYLFIAVLLKKLYIEREHLINKIAIVVILNLIIFENFEMVLINRSVHTFIFIIVAYSINNQYFYLKNKK